MLDFILFVYPIPSIITCQFCLTQNLPLYLYFRVFIYLL